MSTKYLIGEIYLMKFEGSGSVQTGWRPGIILSNNTGNNYSPNVIAIPLTSSMKKLNQPTHVVIPKGEGVPKKSMALCESLTVMPKNNIRDYITVLSDRYMELVTEAVLLAIGCLSFINLDELVSVQQRTTSLNAAFVAA